MLVDGVLLEGGLGALLAAEPLDIRGIGYSADPREFGYSVDDIGRGIVLINTVAEATRQEVESRLPREDWQRQREAWRLRQEEWERQIEALQLQMEKWERRMGGLA